jgi:choline transport protein
MKSECDIVNYDPHNSAQREQIEKSHGSVSEVSNPQQKSATTLERYINLASVINFGVVILASWESFAVTFQFALTNGGPASIFYGSILAGLGACAVGFSLAELASM